MSDVTEDMVEVTLTTDQPGVHETAHYDYVAYDESGWLFCFHEDGGAPSTEIGDAGVAYPPHRVVEVRQ